MRNGLTTGTCAAAAAKAATYALVHGKALEQVEISLPGGGEVIVPIVEVSIRPDLAVGVVRKDAGDDPDVTDKALIKVSVSFDSGADMIITGGEGIGVVTKPGLSVEVGMHAINPVPMSMIINSIRDVTHRGLRVVVEIPGGQALAEKTFNPRLGVVGGLSILGTSGIVKPFSAQAIRDTLKLAVKVALASGIRRPVLTPGRIGHRAIERLFDLPEEQVIEVGNEWGFLLDEMSGHSFERVLVVGHPGKLAKLIMGHWDTHSKRSPSAAPFVSELVSSVLGEPVKSAVTVEATLESLNPDQLVMFSSLLARRISQSIGNKLGPDTPVSTILINLKSEVVGHFGELDCWPTKSI
ncbi:MAG: cobalt-precorrin-5B (C(1))-methyltransferase CbiD [Pseudomonadota bacterium]